MGQMSALQQVYAPSRVHYNSSHFIFFHKAFSQCLAVCGYVPQQPSEVLCPAVAQGAACVIIMVVLGADLLVVCLV